MQQQRRLHLLLFFLFRQFPIISKSLHRPLLLPLLRPIPFQLPRPPLILFLLIFRLLQLLHALFSPLLLMQLKLLIFFSLLLLLLLRLRLFLHLIFCVRLLQLRLRTHVYHDLLFLMLFLLHLLFIIILIHSLLLMLSQHLQPHL